MRWAVPVVRVLQVGRAFAVCLLCASTIGSCGESPDKPSLPDGGSPQSAIPPPVSNPCSTVRCPANATCVVVGSAGQCLCNPGFIVSGQECLADRDNDGLADTKEATFAASVAPILMFSAQEGFKSRFSYWAVHQNGSRLSVFYALAYVQDGGDPLLGLTSHMGDSEFIVLDFVADASGGATFDRAFLSAHFNTLNDHSRWYRNEVSFRQDSLGPHALVWVGRDKHSNFPDVTCSMLDICDAGLAEFVEVLPDRNLGNSLKPLVDRVDRAGGVEYFWTDRPFCGWQVSATGSRADCVPLEDSYARELWAWEQGTL